MNCVKVREALSNSYMKVLAQTHNFYRVSACFGILAIDCKNIAAMLWSCTCASLDLSDQRALAAKHNWCGLKDFINSRCGEIASQFHKRSKSLLVTIRTTHKLKPGLWCHLITCRWAPGFFLVNDLIIIFYVVLLQTKFKSKGEDLLRLTWSPSDAK